MTTKPQQNISTSVKLTDQQRKDLAAALGVDIAHVPHTLGVMGVAEPHAQAMGMPKDLRGKFSPSVVML